jgi:hypothetical protein
MSSSAPSNPDNATVAGKAAPHASSLARGTSVGRYLLLDELGHGGMGVVYKAYDPQLDRPIALKLIQTAEDSVTALRDRLLREAQALARLSHPNVIAVHDVGVFEGQVFVAVEYVEGQTLKQWLAGAQRSQSEILDVFLAAGEGLAAAHRVGLVHRDFKPDNVMVANDGRVRVLDFGLARSADGAALQPGLEASASGERTDVDDTARDRELPSLADERSSNTSKPLSSPLTHFGAVVGTPRFMPLEQHLGKPVDASCDQFSFCVSLHFALYGEFPFPGKSETELIESLREGRFVAPPPGSEVPLWLRRVIVRGLAMMPPDRFPSMAALLDALRADPKVARKRLLRAAALVVAVVAALAAIGVAGVGVKARRDLTEQARLAQLFGEEVEKIAAISRHAAHLPLHDTRRETEAIVARIERLKQRMRALGPLAAGPGHLALGRGYLALGRYDDALGELEAARTTGYVRPELSFALGLVHGKLYERALARLEKTGDAKRDAARRREMVKAHAEPALWYLKDVEKDPDAGVEAPEYVEGLIAFYEQRFDEAIALARKTGERVLWEYEGHTLLGDIHVQAGRERYWKGDIDGALIEFGRAGEAYQAASALAPSGLAAYVGACQQLIEIAEIQVDRAQSPAPTVEAAVAACAKAATARPDDPAPLVAQATAWDTLANYQTEHDADPTEARQRAVRFGESALVVAPRDAGANEIIAWGLLGLAEYRYDQGGDPRELTAQAIPRARRALELNPGLSDVFRLLSRCYGLNGSYEEAHGIDPRKSFETAIEHARKTVALEPESYNAWNTVGDGLSSLGTWQASHGIDATRTLAESVEAFVKVTQLSPALDYGFSNACEVTRTLGETEQRYGRDPRPSFEKSIAFCRQSTRLNANWAGSWQGLGHNYVSLADWQREHDIDPSPSLVEARGALGRALEIDHAHALARQELAKAALTQARWLIRNQRDPQRAFAEAEAQARRALALHASDRAESLRVAASVHRFRAEWRHEQHLAIEQDLRAGLGLAARAVDENPSLASAHVVQGALELVAARAARAPAERRSAAERARAAFDKALAIDATLERELRPLETEATRLAP